jgi:hypothetical protein
MLAEAVIAVKMLLMTQMTLLEVANQQVKALGTEALAERLVLAKVALWAKA